jgi:chitinase
VTDLKKKGLKVLLALGGWNDSAGDKYSRLVSDASSRARFVEHAFEFVKKYNFDGLDLDWEYPKCWQVNCDKGPASDKANFAALTKELSAKFKPAGLLLSAAVSPSKKVIDAGYDVPALSRDLDIINVMTYDYYGHWDKKTGHLAPLKDYDEAPHDVFNAEFTMNYYVEKGAEKSKLIMGMPTYGQAFTLDDPSQNGLGAPASKGQAGPFTRAAGFLAYHEVSKSLFLSLS